MYVCDTNNVFVELQMV